MAMLGNSIAPDGYADEGTVLQVDPQGYLCKVKTLRGKLLNGIPWVTAAGGSTRMGYRALPSVGDRAFIDYRLGNPVITGFLPRPQVQEGSNSLSIHSGDAMPDVGSFRPAGAVVGDVNRPSDLHTGDQVLSSRTGAMLGLLNAGTVLLRASKGAEVLLSRLAGLVRVFSRNWEHFTDVSTDVVKNFKGRVYRYIGYSNTFALAKNEDYRIHFYYGDTVAAETVKSGYNSYSGTPPAANTVLYKEQVTDSAHAELMRRTLDTVGKEEIVVKTADNSVFTRMNATNTQLSFSWKDVTSLIINGTKIHAFDQFGNYIIMQDGNIHVFHHAGADVIMDSSGIRATMGSSHIDMTSSDINAHVGAGQAYVSAAETRIVNGSHAVTVTSGGVAIT